ncbi:unnamed protein product [Candidula unifasciata]|uniref:Uncharacterized protein n=1 Tax=Candidula unifasciata TaxID=100452 RepID=A0A8S3ZAZ7_9EUPU|nr:unnamed protein product [Candidula unifasciata]
MACMWSVNLTILVSASVCCVGVQTLYPNQLSLNDVTERKSGTIYKRTAVPTDLSTEKYLSNSKRHQSKETSNVYISTHQKKDDNFNVRSLSGISKRSKYIDSPELEEIILGKRQNCAIPANKRQDLMVLYRMLNDSYFFGANQEPQTEYRRPADQLIHCVELVELRASQELNSRTICPWLLAEIDIGPGNYPRYFEEATCLCRKCISSSWSFCKYVFRTVSYFKFEGCESGFALMKMKHLQIRTHCYCDKPEPGRDTPVPNYNTE